MEHAQQPVIVATMLVPSAVITKQQVATTIVHAMMAVQQVAQVCSSLVFPENSFEENLLCQEIHDIRNITR